MKHTYFILSLIALCPGYTGAMEEKPLEKKKSLRLIVSLDNIEEKLRENNPDTPLADIKHETVLKTLVEEGKIKKDENNNLLIEHFDGTENASKKDIIFTLENAKIGFRLDVHPDDTSSTLDSKTVKLDKE